MPVSLSHAAPTAEPATSAISSSLRAAGLRATEARVGILRVLAEYGDLLYADAIFLALDQQRAGIGLGTVYRALKLLEHHGLVLREWGDDTGKDRKAMYRSKIAGEGERAVRLVCAGCEHYVELADANLHDHLLRAASRLGLSLPGQPLVLQFAGCPCPYCVTDICAAIDGNDSKTCG